MVGHSGDIGGVGLIIGAASIPVVELAFAPAWKLLKGTTLHGRQNSAQA